MTKPQMPPANSQAFMTMLEIERPGIQDRAWYYADIAARRKCERDTVLGMASYDAWFSHFFLGIVALLRMKRKAAT